MSETIFSRIIEGKLPCFRVYENDSVLAFLDIEPMAFGHTLLVPKQAARTLDELPQSSAEALGRALPLVARAIKAATGCEGYNVLQSNEAVAGQTVFHVHFHIIPKQSANAGLLFRGAGAPMDKERAGALAQQMRGILGVQ